MNSNYHGSNNKISLKLSKIQTLDIISDIASSESPGPVALAMTAAISSGEAPVASSAFCSNTICSMTSEVAPGVLSLPLLRLSCRDVSESVKCDLSQLVLSDHNLPIKSSILRLNVKKQVANESN